jgi:EpsI family protein
MRSMTIRFLLAALMVTSAGVFLRAHSRGEVYPPRLSLQSFPEQIDGWKGSDIAIDKGALAVLGPGDFLQRFYRNPDEQAPDIELFIAYFPSQRTGDTIHSPKNCLPGSGWAPVQSKRITLSAPGHDPFPANRFVVAMGEARRLVLYWYWAHDRGVASEYWAKYYLVTDSIKMHRTDGALVRVILPVNPGETAEGAEKRVMPFVSALVPQLNSYIPR